MSNTTGAPERTGTVVQIIGPVIDVEFEEGHLPEIHHALKIASTGKTPTGVVSELSLWTACW